MSKLLKGNRRAPFGRAVLACASLFALTLAGCGGGGGDAPNVSSATAPSVAASAPASPTVSAGSVTLSVTNCLLDQGEASCLAQAVVDSSGVDGTQLFVSCGPNAQPAGANPSAVMVVAANATRQKVAVRTEAGDNTCEAKTANGTVKAVTVATVQCRPPLVLGREGRCVSNATPTYEYKLYVGQGVKLYLADTVNGVRIPVVNGTSRTGVAACRWALRLTDGTQPFKCDGWKNGVQGEFQAYLDVASNTLRDLPAEKQLFADTVWNTLSLDPVMPAMNAVAAAPDGLYFRKPSDPANVWFRDQSGNERIVLPGTYEQFGSVGYLLAIPVPGTKSGN